MEVELHFTHTPIEIPPPSLPSREIGACVEFHGIVRETEGDRMLAGLHYEAYEPMARRKLERHCAELAATHVCHSLLFIHRLGWVPVGEPSLYLRIFAKHRGPALKMCAELIERLKDDVPVWKVASPRE
jgi:molybdopterin synthase catalytic subunit